MRTITLTNKRPVKIDEKEWPVVARAKGDSWPIRNGDSGRYQQALNQGELDIYYLTVRRHDDGRTLVYGVLDGASVWTGSEDRRGGQLLDKPDDTELIDTVLSVGEDVRIPLNMVRDCIADLEPETL